MKTEIRKLMVLAAVAAAAAPVLAHDELSVGHNNSGRLTVLNEGSHAFLLDMNIPGFPGMSGFPLGLANLTADEPTLGMFVLPNTVNIGFVLSKNDPELTMWNGTTAMVAGDAYMLGAPFFHYHPVWSIAGGVHTQHYHLHGFFRDFSGQYSDSPEVIIEFEVPPPPVCDGDHNGDRSVAFADITYALQNFGNPFDFASITLTLVRFGNVCP